MPGPDIAGDLYKLLGVPRDATLPAIRTAYRQKLEQNKGGDPQVLTRIREAYAVLVSPERRLQYDGTGEISSIQGAAEPEASKKQQALRRSKSESRPMRMSSEAAPAEAAAPFNPPPREAAAAKEPQPRGSAQRLRGKSMPRPRADASASRRTPSRPASDKREAAPRSARGPEGMDRQAVAARTAADANGAGRAAAPQPLLDPPAKSKPCLDSPPAEKLMRSSMATALESAALATPPPVERPARSALSQADEKPRPDAGAGRPELKGAGSRREADVDSLAGSNASTATPTDITPHAEPAVDAVRSTAPRRADAPPKGKSLAEALAAAEAVADTAVKPAAEAAAKAKPRAAPRRARSEAAPKRRPAPTDPDVDEGPPELYATVDTDAPKLYRCMQGKLFAKRSVEPTSQNIVKLARPVGTYIHSTGRRWQGPSGGTWCELAPAHIREDNVRWMLIKGPGFGLSGPALVDASVLKAGKYEAACVKVLLTGERKLERVIFESFMSKDATMWGIKKAVHEATCLNANRLYLSIRVTVEGGAARSAQVPLSAKQSPEVMQQHVKDEQTIRDLNFREEDVVLYLVYTGSFEQDFKPKASGEDHA